ncbi:hypothetical protein [Rhizobium sp. AB2/73]|uniref:hypothetical protein n=1 Tax=Rhizobium/Agrobacterium group TaxID=227290 RepID=UPI001ADAB04E|nr:hypothetical protein [Rhizobium sp. AB2/73]MBO9112556.1 hypothetical protein [Agrobacterium sp. S2/73]QXZ76063.1 hypothetical protein J5276_28785 [Agrobacterium sp. S7/73]QYA16928.1 hypothetical protein J5284_32725 [Rhizobium sp. AB2/73]UEQ85499.1 hypothetical protein I8E17_31335 [Rhizobium sp. AB2/73]
MLDEAEDIALGFGQRIKLTAAAVYDDDNLPAAPVFDCPPCAFLQIDREPRLLQHDGARDTIP